jgi:hypothetical protein
VILKLIAVKGFCRLRRYQGQNVWNVCRLAKGRVRTNAAIFLMLGRQILIGRRGKLRRTIMGADGKLKLSVLQASNVWHEPGDDDATDENGEETQQNSCAV